jgi:uncharacterized membrane protein YfcA
MDADHFVDSPWAYLLLVCTGFVAGTLNVLAGGGSFLTLPVLIFLGLPPGLANGTNRVGIFLQNVSAVTTFRRQGVLDWQSLSWATFPAILGAAVGAGFALWISDDAFQRVLAFLMVAVSLWTLGSAKRQEEEKKAPPPTLMLALGFFLAGIYGGFVQAGVGFLILAVTTAAGLDLVRGNAVKVLAIMGLTGLALIIFAWQGRVDWLLGLCLAAGTSVGGVLGARLTVLKGHRWVKRVVTAMVVVFAVKLWLAT